MDMLTSETDDEHGLSMPQIISRLAEQGVSAERKSVYDDFASLREYGFDVVARSGRPTVYALGERKFEDPEVILLIDAVLSSRFLTDKKSKELAAKLSGLTSRHLAQKLNKQIYVAGRIKMQNESVFYNIDIIHQALSLRQCLSFQYYDYNFQKIRVPRRDGERYTVSPLGLAYVDEFYYLITYNERYQSITPYRVDRMKSVAVEDAPAVNPPAEMGFDMVKHTNRVFKMFEGETIQVALTIQGWAMNPIIDRFGKDAKVEALDDEHATVYVSVTKTPEFFGWLAAFGDGVRISEPVSLAEEYKAYLQQIAALY